MDAESTRATARHEDFRPVVDELVVTVFGSAGLAGVVVLLTLGSRVGPGPAALGLTGVFAAWACLHLMYATRYARMFYDRPEPAGIDFNTDHAPAYRDFFYFSFAIGMTYGVTDAAVTASDVKAVVLRHSVLSYVFGAAILATMINLVVGVFAR